MTEETLIDCFAVAPVRHNGKTKVSCDIRLTASQVERFQKMTPCPIVVKQNVVDEPLATSSAPASSDEKDAKAESTDLVDSTNNDSSDAGNKVGSDDSDSSQADGDKSEPQASQQAEAKTAKAEPEAKSKAKTKPAKAGS